MVVCWRWYMRNAVVTCQIKLFCNNFHYNQRLNHYNVYRTLQLGWSSTSTVDVNMCRHSSCTGYQFVTELPQALQSAPSCTTFTSESLRVIWPTLCSLYVFQSDTLWFALLIPITPRLCTKFWERAFSFSGPASLNSLPAKLYTHHFWYQCFFKEKTC